MRTSRRLILFVFVYLGLFSGINATAAPGESAVILQYHHVSTTSPAVSSITPEDFRKHMRYLRDNDFEVLPLPEVLETLQRGEMLPERTAVITFDDNYLSVYEDAFPLLKEYDWPFTVFVSAGLVSESSRLYASWEQLREMGEHGATLANHTMSHPHLLERNGQSEADWLESVRREIVNAEDKIREETGQSHRLLAYPYGEYNPRIQQMMRELDYVGFGQHSGPVSASSNFTALPRFPFGGIYVNMDGFRPKVNSLAFTLEEVRPDSPVTEESSPSAYLNFAPGEYRLSQLTCFNSNESMTVEKADETDAFNIHTPVENRSRRFRYNCTAPGPQGRYYWYSIDWVNPGIPE